MKGLEYQNFIYRIKTDDSCYRLKSKDWGYFSVFSCAQKYVKVLPPNLPPLNSECDFTWKLVGLFQI